MKEALALCDRLLVHSIADMNRLKDLGLTANVAFIPARRYQLLRSEASRVNSSLYR